jgi:hypothetical protein
VSGNQYVNVNDVEVRSETGETLAGRPRKPGTHARFAVNAQFIMWDGEACKDTGYCYFANSAGDSILEGRQLTTIELLTILLQGSEDHPNAIHFGYGFDYDIDNILMDVPKRILAILNRYGKARWKSGNALYQFEYIPRKIFSVRMGHISRDGGRRSYVPMGSIKIFDVVSFFNCRYDKALLKYGIGTGEELEKLESGKEEREFFLYRNIDRIIEYCQLELAMGPLLMDKLRMAIHGAGYKTTQWYGPGAISKLMLKQHATRKVLSHGIPDSVSVASRYAYAGGWFERFGIGFHEGDVWIPDINSAYPYAMSLVPNLRTGVWHHISNPDPLLASKYRLGFYRIRYDIPREGWEWSKRAYPLFRRQANGSIIHGPRVENWYHAPEANSVATDPHAQFLEAWVYEDDGTYPLAWIQDDYLARQKLKQDRNPAELGIKLGLNAMYGTLAQQVGWDRKTGDPPSWHQLEIAGYATSMCRAMAYGAYQSVGKGILSFDTDGLITTVKPDVNEGSDLGQWEVSHYTGVVFLQNGLYWLRDDNGEWLPPKTRGVNRRRIPLDVETAFSVLRGDGTIDITKHMYTGFKAALQGKWDKRGTWNDVPFNLNIHTSGNRKHYVLSNMLECDSCKQGMGMLEGIHPTRLFLDPRCDFESKPHKLEWLEDIEESERKFNQWLISIDE